MLVVLDLEALLLHVSKQGSADLNFFNDTSTDYDNEIIYLEVRSPINI